MIPPVYDLIGYDEVYQSSQCYIPFQWRKKKRSIIITGEPESLDLSAMLLKNEITPRISEFHELIESGAITVNDAESSHSVAVEELRHEDLSMRLYRVEGSSSPVLYVYSEPYGLTNFPLSHSAFFSAEDGQLKELLSGYQCGGSLGGDFVHLWFDREEEAVKFGVSGEFGGFGGIHTDMRFIVMKQVKWKKRSGFILLPRKPGIFCRKRCWNILKCILMKWVILIQKKQSLRQKVFLNIRLMKSRLHPGGIMRCLGDTGFNVRI